MKCFKPNDTRCGDVIEHTFMRLYKSLLLVVSLDQADRRVDYVLLAGSGLPSAIVPGQRYTVTYTRKQWKRYEENFRYLSRGWDETLRLQ